MHAVIVWSAMHNMTIIRSRLYSVASVYNRLIICTNHSPGLVDSKFSQLQPTAEFRLWSEPLALLSVAISPWWWMKSPNNIPVTQHQPTTSVLDSTKLILLTPNYSFAIGATLLCETNGHPSHATGICHPPSTGSFAGKLASKPLFCPFVYAPKPAIFVVSRRSQFSGDQFWGSIFERKGSSVWPLVCWIQALAALCAGNQQRHER